MNDNEERMKKGMKNKRTLSTLHSFTLSFIPFFFTLQHISPFTLINMTVPVYSPLFPGCKKIPRILTLTI
jgi:hypothetical protein